MIRAFNMRCDDPRRYSDWVDRGQKYFADTWPRSARGLEAFVQGGDISGDALKKHWFSSADTHVFISHSHQDRELALGLAGYLHSMELAPFVDSLVWGDSSKLLRGIDEKFCKSAQGENFDYQKRNYSTSHVHMMLASALTEMIDRTDAVIFLNTPNSIRASSSSAPGDAVTASPWIYHELVTTKIAREVGFKGRKLSQTRPLRTLREVTVEASMTILHKPPMDHLASLAPVDLDELKATGAKGLALLDKLYWRRRA